MPAPASSTGISPILDIADTPSPILRDVAGGDAPRLRVRLGIRSPAGPLNAVEYPLIKILSEAGR